MRASPPRPGLARARHPHRMPLATQPHRPRVMPVPVHPCRASPFRACRRPARVLHLLRQHPAHLRQSQRNQLPDQLRSRVQLQRLDLLPSPPRSSSPEPPILLASLDQLWHPFPSGGLLPLLLVSWCGRTPTLPECGGPLQFQLKIGLTHRFTGPTLWSADYAHSPRMQSCILAQPAALRSADLLLVGSGRRYLTVVRRS